MVAKRERTIGAPAEPTILPMKPAGGAYFNRLDAVRGTAILWVLVFHTCGACWGWNLPKWSKGWDDWPFWLALPGQTAVRVFSMGNLGVPMFFVLSGFLIHYTFSRGSTQTTVGFWLRRLGRIYPPYLAALLVFAVAYGFLWTAGGRGNLFSHLFFVHTFNNNTFFSINGSFWSLAHEAQFYLLYPLLLRVRRSIGMPALVWGSLAARLGIGIWLEMSHAAAGPALSMMLPRMYFEWILGMYVADQLVAGRRAFNCQPGVGWLCLACAYFGHQRGWLNLASMPAISVATAIWIDRIVHVPHEPNRMERLLIPLGVISYSLYLWHQPIVAELTARIFRSPRGLEAIGAGGLFFTDLAICSFVAMIAAVGAYRLIEVPSIELTKRWVKLLEQRHPLKDGSPTAEAQLDMPVDGKKAA
jgi:peptidoglycan/LPS O-acetylase OafA/YrhL